MIKFDQDEITIFLLSHTKHWVAILLVRMGGGREETCFHYKNNLLVVYVKSSFAKTYKRISGVQGIEI